MGWWGCGCRGKCVSLGVFSCNNININGMKSGFKLIVVAVVLLVSVMSAWGGRRSVTWKYGELIMGDDEFTGAVLDYLIKPSMSKEDALNDSVFWEICLLSDGCLSEMLGSYVMKGIKGKKGFIERLIGKDAFYENSCFFIANEFLFDYYDDLPKNVKRQMTAEDVFNSALKDLRVYLNWREYQYLLMECKPTIVQWLNKWIE